MRFETHSHSMYSNIRLIDAICKPEQLIQTAYDLGYAGITLTDHEALCGHIDFLNAENSLKEKGKISQEFKCGLGNEIYLVENRTPHEAQQYFHFILIAKNEIGHRALRELSSNAWLNSYRYRGMERVPTLYSELEDIVKKYPNSLIGTNACIGGQIGSLVLNLVEAETKGDLNKIYDYKSKIDSFIKWCKSLFGDDFYLEIAPGSSTDQKKFNKRIKNIASFYNIKMIIATDAHYLTAEQREIHKSFLNSKNGEREVDSFYYDAHLMKDLEAFDKLKQFYSEAEFDIMCNNSLEIMNKIESYNIFHNPIIPEVDVQCGPPVIDNELNNYPILQKLKNSTNIQERRWAYECIEQLKIKKLYNNEYLKRLETEADILRHISQKMGNCLFSYFNTFQHYIDLFWDCGSIQGPGRGSASGFLSNYLLGITQLDPIEWELPYFRFLNKERAELPDIDVDLSPSKRPLILQKIREERGELNVVQVATFGTTSSKDALKVAARGLGIDVDIAQYLSNLVPVERGIVWPLKDCFFGNEDEGRKPIKELVNQVAQYPNLKEVAFGIENLVVRRGQHASGVILYNNSPYDTTALMRSPNGDITTQFDLHRSEQLGDTKFDFLVTDICDKISTTLELLQNDGYFEGLSKREIYNKILHPSVLNYNNSKMWDALAAGSVLDVFQFNTQIGTETAKMIQPHNPIELTAANALLRLAAPEGQERPLTRYVKFKNDISLWYKEMDEAGLSKSEQKVLEKYYLPDYGVPASQELLMLCVMDKDLTNFSLAESNAIRKCLAKKKIAEIPKWENEVKTRAKSKELGNYLWETMARPQMSYSFSKNHALPYSFIGIQTLYLATQFPSIYWNCACLIVNSHSIEDNEETDNTEELLNYSNEMEEFSEDDSDEDIDESYDEKDCDGYPAEVCKMSNGKKKKKIKPTNYGKVSAAIGKMKMEGVEISHPDINDSTFTFSPDVKNNAIRYGLSGITRISKDLINEIIKNRPYSSLQDFLKKVKVNKLQAVNLIKSGVFDCFGDRLKIMEEYIEYVSDTKKRITLQNMKMLIDFNLIPDEYDFQCRVFNYNKYLKKFKNGKYYIMDNIAYEFYEKNFDVDKLVSFDSESGFAIEQTKWDTIYKKQQDIIRPYIKENSEKLLIAVNNRIIQDLWNKYCDGSISKWEMDSISCYIHKHELAYINRHKYGIDNFFDLDEKPVVERLIPIKGKMVPIFKLNRICGTVLDRDKAKKTVTLLTTDGVVTVKIYGMQFVYYDRQLSEKDYNGKKHIVRKSEFSRGNKIVVTGIREGDNFIAKKYKNTPYHLLLTIDKISPMGDAIFYSRNEEND